MLKTIQNQHAYTAGSGFTEVIDQTRSLMDHTW